MAEPINDGGPAFPTAQHLSGCDHEKGCVHECPVASIPNVSGMSLRDYFAGQALAGIMTLSANVKYLEQVTAIAEKNEVTPDDVLAAIALNAADAMMKARAAK